MAYGITSSGQLIDIGTISNGCKQIETAAEKFEESANKILAAADICDANALSIDKTTMQNQLELDAEYIKSMKTAIYEFTKEIRSIATEIYGAQSNELEQYQANQNK